MHVMCHISRCWARALDMLMCFQCFLPQAYMRSTPCSVSIATPYPALSRGYKDLGPA